RRASGRRRLRRQPEARRLHPLSVGGIEAARRDPLLHQGGRDPVPGRRHPQERALRSHAAPLPGGMTLADLAGYQPKVTPALCRPYRVYVVCTAPDPAGGSALLEGLRILAHTDIDKRGPSDPQAWFLLGQAERLMYA